MRFSKCMKEARHTFIKQGLAWLIWGHDNENITHETIVKGR